MSVDTHSTANGRPAPTARQAAAKYTALGLTAIPLPPGKKRLPPRGWRKLRADAADLDVRFPEGRDFNIGIALGKQSNRIVTIDIDCTEARMLAKDLLPRTGWVEGRPGHPETHWYYRCQDTPRERVRFLDPTHPAASDDERSVLVELLGEGCYVVAPPSIWMPKSPGPDDRGERRKWVKLDKAGPAEKPWFTLRSHAADLAAATLLSKHWPEAGCRDELAMALTGALVRSGCKNPWIQNFIEATARAAGDEEWRSRGAKVERTIAKLAEGGKVTGWRKVAEILGEEHGRKIVKAIRKWLELEAKSPSADSRTPAEPIVFEPPPWPEPLAEEAYHGLAGRIVRLIEPASEADPAALLVQFLVGFGSLVGKAAHFRVEADRHHTNQFVVLVGDTSKARKGTSWGQISSILREADEEWADNRVLSGASSGEGIIWCVRDAILSRERVNARGEPVRYEEVEKDPGIEDKRLLVYEGEYSNVLKQIERQGNTLSPILRLAWDGKNLQALTKNSPARSTGAHVSIIGHITETELRRYLTETETANGFANRNLWICARRSKLLPEGGQVDENARQELLQDLASAITFARSDREMTRDDEAREVWLEAYGPLSQGRPGLAGALLARGEAHVTRLAMIYALLDCSEWIQAPHLLAAMALWHYAVHSVEHVFGDSLGDPIADDLLRMLRKSPGGMTRNQIREFFHRNVPAPRIGQALGLLQQNGLARFQQEASTGGRPAELWHAVAKSAR